MQDLEEVILCGRKRERKPKLFNRDEWMPDIKSIFKERNKKLTEEQLRAASLILLSPKISLENSPVQRREDSTFLELHEKVPKSEIGETVEFSMRQLQELGVT